MRMFVATWRRSFLDGVIVIGAQLVIDFEFAVLHDLRSSLMIPLTLSGSARVPTMVVASARDRLLPSLSEAGRLVSLIPGALRVVLPDSGHTALLESKVRAAWYGTPQLTHTVSLAEKVRDPRLQRDGAKQPTKRTHATTIYISACEH